MISQAASSQIFNDDQLNARKSNWENITSGQYQKVGVFNYIGVKVVDEIIWYINWKKWSKNYRYDRQSDGKI